MNKWIEIARPYFPVSQLIKKGDTTSLASSVVMYLILIFAVRLIVGGILGAIPLLGLLFKLVSAAFSLYGLAGLLMSLYEYYR